MGYYFRRARKRAGLNDDITFHDLRHFFASVLIPSGCSIKQVQMALGHDSARITLDTYAHLIPGDEDRVRDAIEARFRPTHPVSGSTDTGSSRRTGAHMPRKPPANAA